MARQSYPWDEEAEISVLGACIIDPSKVSDVVEALDEEAFYHPSYKAVYRAIIRLFERGVPVEHVLLRRELIEDGMHELDAMQIIGDLVECVVTSANIAYHIGILKDFSTRRKLIEAGTDIVRSAATTDGTPVSSIADKAQQSVYEATNGRGSAGPVLIKKTLWPALELVEKYQAAQGGVTGVGTGFRQVDEMTGGWQKGDLVIIAARPSMGKTAMVVGSALHAAITRNVPVVIFSLEMTKEQLVQRMLCHEALVDLSTLMRGSLSTQDYARLAHAAEVLDNAPIWIDDRPGVSALEIRAKARRLKAERPDLGLIIVDYLQLMTMPDAESREKEVSAISRSLKGLGKELGLPVIALSQLSRKCEERMDKRPQLSDLRESGSLEQDADIVAFLYRPEYYGVLTDSMGRDLHGVAEFIIRKHRNGPVDTVELMFRKEFTRFEDLHGSRHLAVA